MLSTFRHVVVADFEFEFGGHASFEEAGRSGERPRPVCMVAKELRSGQVWRLWRGEFGPGPPFPIGPDTLFVAYYASAELGCFRALGWPKPANILDLFTEFRDRTNGLVTPAGAGLIGALTYFGLDTIGATEKDEMRASILRGGPWLDGEREEIIKYCATDRCAQTVAAGDAAAHRSAASTVARQVHGRRRRDGIRRRADRSDNAGVVAHVLDRYSGRTHPRDRR
jgi:hypothetical protein